MLHYPLCLLIFLSFNGYSTEARCPWGVCFPSTGLNGGDLGSWSLLKTAPLSSKNTVDKKIAHGAVETTQQTKLIIVPVTESRTLRLARTKYREERVPITRYERVRTPYTVTQYKLVPVMKTKYMIQLVPRTEKITRKIPYTTFEDKRVKSNRGFQLFRGNQRKEEHGVKVTPQEVDDLMTIDHGIPVVEQQCPMCVLSCPPGCIPIHQARAMARNVLRSH